MAQEQENWDDFDVTLYKNIPPDRPAAV